MKIILAIIGVLALSEDASTVNCPAIPVYNTTIKQMCVGSDTKVLWPNYKNVHQYYRCQGENNPVLVDCFPFTIFDFSKQMCTKCSDYMPAPPCQAIKAKSDCTLFTPVTTPKPMTTSPPYCFELVIYKTWYLPICTGNEVYRLWPNYKNVSEYFRCQGHYNPKIESCAPGTYFNYYTQTCTDCYSYVPAPECHKLIEHIHNCHKI